MRVIKNIMWLTPVYYVNILSTCHVTNIFIYCHVFMTFNILVDQFIRELFSWKLRFFLKLSPATKVFLIFEADFLISLQIITKGKCVSGYLCCVFSPFVSRLKRALAWETVTLLHPHVDMQVCPHAHVRLHANPLARAHQRCLAGMCGLNEKSPRLGWDKQVRKFNLTLPAPVVIGKVGKGQVCQDSRILGVWVAKPIWGPVCSVLTFALDASAPHGLSLLPCAASRFALTGVQGECDYPWLHSGVRSGVTCMDLLDCFGRTKKMRSLCLSGRREPATRAGRG